MVTTEAHIPFKKVYKADKKFSLGKRFLVPLPKNGATACKTPPIPTTKKQPTLKMKEKMINNSIIPKMSSCHSFGRPYDSKLPLTGFNTTMPVRTAYSAVLNAYQHHPLAPTVGLKPSARTPHISLSNHPDHRIWHFNNLQAALLRSGLNPLGKQLNVAYKMSYFRSI